MEFLFFFTLCVIWLLFISLIYTLPKVTVSVYWFYSLPVFFIVGEISRRVSFSLYSVPDIGLRSTFQVFQDYSVFLYQTTIVDVFLTVYMMGTVLYFVMFISEYALLGYRARISTFHSELTDFARNFQKEIGISKTIPVHLSYHQKSPFSFGLIKPVIVIPEHLYITLSAEELKYVFVHEMIHIKHKDFLRQGLDHFITSLFWFNPVFQRIKKSRIIEREIICDRAVINYLGNKKNYVELLLRLTEEIDANKRLIPVVSLFKTNAQLKTRIENIVVERQRLQPNYVNHFIFLCFLFLSCVDSSSKFTKNTEVINLLSEIETFKKKSFAYSETTKKPTIVSMETFPFPPELHENRYHASVEMTFDIDEFGYPISVDIHAISTNMPYQTFKNLKKLMLQTALNFTFTPGMIDGECVRTRWIIPYQFTPNKN